MLPVLSASAVFLSAALLFVVQPLLAKQLLPLLGGTPTVWNTCVVFFQLVLLVGYRYADAVRGKPWVHLVGLLAGGGLLLAGGLLKPNAELVPADAGFPPLGVFAVLLVAVGGPFLALSATAPLVQAWYAAAGRANPYPLYAASNAGSLLGLAAYPLVIEPAFPVGEQRIGWAVGYAACAGLVAACGIWSRLAVGSAPPPPAGEGVGGRGGDFSLGGGSTPAPAPPPPGEGSQAEPLPRRLRWLLLAALPSALLLAATQHLTTDIAPVPLLWAVPLGLYLITYIVAFAYWPPTARRLLGRVTPVALCALAVALLTKATEPVLVTGGVHLIALVCVCLLCHGELAADRPPADRLTRFYLWTSAGGVVGGLFVALAAPVLFARLGTVEYPLLLAVAGLVRPNRTGPWFKASDALAAIALATAVVVLLAVVPLALGPPPPPNAGMDKVLIDKLVRGGLTFGVPAAVAFALVWRPVRFALCLVGLFAAAWLADGGHGDTLEVRRNSFGTLRVARAEERLEDGRVIRFVRLMHGTTLHGQQRLDVPDPPPTMYYHRQGPLGRLFAVQEPKRIGVVGLGCGATAAYAQPGQTWAFYEIDPDVVAVARDTRFFTYLSSCPVEPAVILGDARRRLVEAPDGSFDLLVLDAFSSDAVPAHLLTREAFELYRAKLAPTGVLAMHLSNRYLDLPPLAARQCAAVGLATIWDADMGGTEADRADGKFPSVWVAAAREPGLFRKPKGWIPLAPTAGPVWTDDFSNLLGVWKTDE